MTYTVFWSVEDNEWVAVCEHFPSLSWLAASPEKALKGLRRLIADVEVDMALEQGYADMKHWWREFSADRRAFRDRLKSIEKS